MTELIRDTILGHALRLLSGGKLLPYEEDRDPSLWRRYVDKEASRRMAHHGHTGEAEKNGAVRNSNDDSSQTQQNIGIPRHSSDTQVNGQAQRGANSTSGITIDPEMGRDVTIVTWFTDNDPEVDSRSLSVGDKIAYIHRILETGPHPRNFLSPFSYVF